MRDRWSGMEAIFSSRKSVTKGKVRAGAANVHSPLSGCLLCVCVFVCELIA